LQAKDKDLRTKLANELKNLGYSTKNADNIAQLDLFNQNTHAEWFDPEWMFGINTGFDIVIGNPPYVSTRNLDISLKHIYGQFELAKGQYDLFVLFIEKSNTLLKQSGIFSFIIPKKLLTNENFLLARNFLLKNLPITKYLDAQMPFEAAAVEANVIICKRTTTSLIETYLFDGMSIVHKFDVAQNLINYMPFNIFPFAINPTHIAIIEHILQNATKKLGDFVEVIRGMECGFNYSSISKSGGDYKIIKGEHIEKYNVKNTEWLVTPDFVKDKKIFKSKEIYLTIPKLVTKFVSNTLDFALDEIGYFNTNVVYNVIPKKGYENNLLFLLGLCNSKLLNFWFFNTYVNDDKLFPHIQKNQLDSIPIPAVSLSQQQPLISLVNEILTLKKTNQPAEALEKEIDRLVYELYGLSEEEIEIIEGKRV
jgi:hypothetical protein